MLAVYVTNIHEWITDKELIETFSIFGPVEDVEIIESDTDPSEPIGLVVFRFDRDATEAARCLNGATLDIGDHVSVRAVTRVNKRETAVCQNTAEDLQKNIEEQTLVFVKNFDDLLDENKLKIMFEVFGEVKSVSIKREKGKPKGYGFVDFTEHKCAVEAVKVMDGRKIRGIKKIRVTFAQTKEEREQKVSEDSVAKVSENSNMVLYVKNLPKSFTEGDLRDMFEVYGEILSVSIKSREKASTSVGFVCFALPENALKAQKHMHGKHFQSETLEVYVKGEQNSKQINLHDTNGSDGAASACGKQSSRNAIGHLFSDTRKYRRT